MASIFDKDGIQSIENREVTFKNGSPVNMPEWDMFKQIPNRIKFERIMVDKWSVEKCFNPVVCLWTGNTIQSSFDRFKIFCRENNIRVVEREDPFTFLLISNFN